MKRWTLFVCMLMFILGVSGKAVAIPIYVPDYGDTGWQTFSFTFPYDFTGDFLFVVSDYGDNVVNSYLLVDNLSAGPTGNTGFENGDFTGYTTFGTCTVVTSFTNPGNNAFYTPTEGSYMALLDSVDGNSGYSTVAWGGTDGSAFTIASQVFSAGETFSFDWAFATTDYAPWYDFAEFVITGTYTTPGGNTIPVYETYRLAQINPVPEPGTLFLLGSGLFGLAGLGRKRIKKS